MQENQIAWFVFLGSWLFFGSVISLLFHKMFSLRVEALEKKMKSAGFDFDWRNPFVFQSKRLLALLHALKEYKAANCVFWLLLAFCVLGGVIFFVGGILFTPHT
ncbi:MAG: hypothetical protein EOM12_12095 [Verrucomicrobiae bacterium]|nr:hypothetical protein [Verrucomicrobiae bacterium]